MTCDLSLPEGNHRELSASQHKYAELQQLLAAASPITLSSNSNDALLTLPKASTTPKKVVDELDYGSSDPKRTLSPKKPKPAK